MTKIINLNELKKESSQQSQELHLRTWRMLINQEEKYHHRHFGQKELTQNQITTLYQLFQKYGVHWRDKINVDRHDLGHAESC